MMNKISVSVNNSPKFQSINFQPVQFSTSKARGKVKRFKTVEKLSLNDKRLSIYEQLNDAFNFLRLNNKLLSDQTQLDRLSAEFPFLFEKKFVEEVARYSSMSNPTSKTEVNPDQPDAPAPDTAAAAPDPAPPSAPDESAPVDQVTDDSTRAAEPASATTVAPADEPNVAPSPAAPSDESNKPLSPVTQAGAPNKPLSPTAGRTDTPAEQPPQKPAGEDSVPQATPAKTEAGAAPPTTVEPKAKPDAPKQGDLPLSDSAILKELVEADERANNAARMIEQVRKQIAEYAKKEEMTDEDVKEMQKKQAELMEMMSEFEDITRRVQHLVGLVDVASNQLGPPQKPLVEGVRTTSPGKSTLPEDTLPKVIVCGTGSVDHVPKIIVCEPTKSGDGRQTTYKQLEGKRSDRPPKGTPTKPKSTMVPSISPPSCGMPSTTPGYPQQYGQMYGPMGGMGQMPPPMGGMGQMPPPMGGMGQMPPPMGFPGGPGMMPPFGPPMMSSPMCPGVESSSDKAQEDLKKQLKSLKHELKTKEKENQELKTKLSCKGAGDTGFKIETKEGGVCRNVLSNVPICKADVYKSMGMPLPPPGTQAQCPGAKMAAAMGLNENQMCRSELVKSLGSSGPENRANGDAPQYNINRPGPVQAAQTCKMQPKTHPDMKARDVAGGSIGTPVKNPTSTDRSNKRYGGGHESTKGMMNTSMSARVFKRQPVNDKARNVFAEELPPPRDRPPPPTTSTSRKPMRAPHEILASTQNKIKAMVKLAESLDRRGKTRSFDATNKTTTVTARPSGSAPTQFKVIAQTTQRSGREAKISSGNKVRSSSTGDASRPSNANLPVSPQPHQFSKLFHKTPSTLKNMKESIVQSMEQEVRSIQKELELVQAERRGLELQKKLLTCTSGVTGRTLQSPTEAPRTVPCPAAAQPFAQAYKQQLIAQSNLKECTSALECQLSSLREQYRKLQQDYNSKVEEVSMVRVEYDAAKRDALSLLQKCEEAEARVDDLLERLKAVENEKLKMASSKDTLMELEQQLVLAKQRYREGQEELEEMRTAATDQMAQLEDYRNKYLTAQQTVEEQRRQLDIMEMENNRIGEQVNLEIQRVKTQFKEKLQELTPLPDMLKATQLKLQESQQLRNLAERNVEQLKKELDELKEKNKTTEKELEEFKKDTTMSLTERANLQNSLSTGEKRIEEIKSENTKLRATVARLEELALNNERRFDEKTHEALQLSTQLETLREESARQVSRTKDRCEAVRRTLQSQISELERQLAQSRATARTAQKDRDEIRQRMQAQITSLNENFEQAQMRIRSLQSHVNYLKNSYTNIFAPEQCMDIMPPPPADNVQPQLKNLQ